MTKIRLNYIQLLFLITAFFTIQWTTTHIHFSQQHNHDGSLHQHQIQTHAHQYIAIEDSSSVLSHSNIIEFENDYTFKNRKIEKPSFSDIDIEVSNTIPTISLAKKKIPIFVNIKQGYSHYSSYKPRAPPLNS
jgi:hypothetical protein